MPVCYACKACIALHHSFSLSVIAKTRMSERHWYTRPKDYKLSRICAVAKSCSKPLLHRIALLGVLTLQAIVDLTDALEAASLGKSRERQQQLSQQQAQLLQWLRHKLPTNTDLAQV